MAFNMVVLAALSYGVYMLVTTNAEDNGLSGLGRQEDGPGLVDRLKGEARSDVPVKEQYLDPEGVYFGAATENAPYDKKELNQLAADAGGIRPSMTSFFLAWHQKFNPYSVTASWQHGTLPVLTWEPWGGGRQNPTPGTVLKSNIIQPRYRLANIIDGKFDAYITKTARDIAGTKLPVALRFGHEMNGIWYPWAERVNGNHRGEYVKAYQHVYDLFQQAGADNVIWIWAPNIVRPEPEERLEPLYPGDEYVDWIGMTGYGVREKSPEITFGATMKEIRTFSDKPLMIMETGAQIDDDQLAWMDAFFPWLKKHDEIIGFIWMQKDRDTGARSNWRFTSSHEVQQAFQAGLATLELATGPAKTGGGA
ncbi:hypothetical protein SRB5_34820 [Streptomyces sp. RB5]|uniref:GH26 domain-containing protein n=2 Tax=Streptomyces smaragdinus TaxID=2585196 RepID=A0A7K0CIM9_9ACTN|nr:hypothetical protein [Streptomyces smaragdinus]